MVEQLSRSRWQSTSAISSPRPQPARPLRPPRGCPGRLSLEPHRTALSPAAMGLDAGPRSGGCGDASLLGVVGPAVLSVGVVAGQAAWRRARCPPRLPALHGLAYM